MTRGLRIAFITPEYVSERYFSGGLANYIYRVSKALVSQGNRVHVVTLSDTDDLEFDHEGIHVHRITTGPLRGYLKRIGRNPLPGTCKWLDFSFQAYRKLRELQKQTPFDIIQVPNSRACGIFAGLLLSVPYVVRISCYRPVWNELSGLDRRLDEKITEWLEWLQLRLCRYIYAPSHTLKRMLAERANIKGVRVLRTPFYLENTEWDTSLYDEHLKNKKYLMFFGRFQLHKGFHILAQALPDVLQAHLDCHAVFVGLDLPSRLADSMKEYVLSLCGKDTDRLVFFGQTRHAQLYPVIAGARLVILPSLIDNLPNACLEAMALGKPVIGTIGASFEEVISDGETGFLVPPDDPQVLAKKINESWTHPSLAEVGEAARRKVQDLSPERTVRDLLDYFAHILQGKQSRTGLDFESGRTSNSSPMVDPKR